MHAHLLYVLVTLVCVISPLYFGRLRMVLLLHTHVILIVSFFGCFSCYVQFNDLKMLFSSHFFAYQISESPDHKKQLDEHLVGSRIKVWWPDDKM